MPKKDSLRTTFDHTMAHLTSAKAFADSSLANVMKAHYASERSRLRDAMVFHLDNDFLETIVQSSANLTPRKMLMRLPLARLPYEKVWIEYDNFHRVRVQNKLGTSPLPPDDVTPERMGWLIERTSEDRAAWTARAFIADGSPTILKYHVDEDGVEANPDTRQLTDGGAFGRSRFFPWGFLPHAGDVTGMQGIADLKRLMDRVYTDVPLADAFMSIAPEKFPLAVQKDQDESRGDVRFLVNIFAMLNVVNYTLERKQPGRSMTVGMKQIPYTSYSIISLALPMKRRLENVEKLLNRAEKQHRRAHQVRGHFRHILDRETGLIEKVWIKEHVRGDASLGWVHQAYELTKA